MGGGGPKHFICSYFRVNKFACRGSKNIAPNFVFLKGIVVRDWFTRCRCPSWKCYLDNYDRLDCCISEYRDNCDICDICDVLMISLISPTSTFSFMAALLVLSIVNLIPWCQWCTGWLYNIHGDCDAEKAFQFWPYLSTYCVWYPRCPWWWMGRISLMARDFTWFLWCSWCPSTSAQIRLCAGGLVGCGWGRTAVTTSGTPGREPPDS